MTQTASPQHSHTLLAATQQLECIMGVEMWQTLEVSQGVDGKYALLSSAYDICLGCAQAGV